MEKAFPNAAPRPIRERGSTLRIGPVRQGDIACGAAATPASARYPIHALPLQSVPRAVTATGMRPPVVHVVEQLLARLPQWIRQDLMANDPLARSRAEETLAAMIAAALGDGEAGGGATVSGDAAATGTIGGA